MLQVIRKDYKIYLTDWTPGLGAINNKGFLRLPDRPLGNCVKKLRLFCVKKENLFKQYEVL